MSTEVARYLMNPAEDTLLLGDELSEGMWVLMEDPYLRRGSTGAEEERIRAQRFCRVTRLRRHGEHIYFIGEWVDGYQEARSNVHTDSAWIVKKDSIPAAEPTPET